MGEMADMLNEQMEHDWLNDFSGDGGDLREVGEYLRLIRGPKPITCKSCGKQNLRWEKMGERWFLFKGKSVHFCKKKPLPLEFLKALVALRRAEEKIKKLTQKKK